MSDANEYSSQEALRDLKLELEAAVEQAEILKQRNTQLALELEQAAAAKPDAGAWVTIDKSEARCTTALAIGGGAFVHVSTPTGDAMVFVPRCNVTETSGKFNLKTF